MATTRWLGGAKAVAQVTQYVFAATWESTDVINLVIGSKTLSVVAGSTVAATIVGTIVTAFNALDSTLYPEFAGITASASTATLILTADDEGVPFICTITTTETGGGAADTQTIDGAASSTGTDSTACSGPNFWSVAANWSGGAVPVDTDAVCIENNAVPIKYGLAQTAVTLASLNIAASYTGEIGLPEVNSDGPAAYPEYRAQFLAIKATLVNIGRGTGQGSQRIKLDNSTAQVTGSVHATGTGAEADVPALCWKGTHASNAWNIYGGSVGLAFYAGESATVATLRTAGDAVVIGGLGLTLTTLTQQGGSVTLQAGLTTVTKADGDLLVTAGNVTTWTDDGGRSVYDGVGTVGTLNVGGGAEVDFGVAQLAGCTVTNANLYEGAALRDPMGRVTWTNPFRLVRCRFEDGRLDLGLNRTVQVG